MSAGTNGGAMPPNNASNNAPDGDDDPFAYLYRPDGQSSAQAAPPGRPAAASYHDVRPVGERSYGGQPGYGQQGRQQGQRPQGYGQPGYGQQGQRPQPDAYYAAPEVQPGGAAPSYGQPHGGSPRRSAPEPLWRNGLLLAAIAVVLAVVAGVGAAILFSGDDPATSGDQTSQSPSGDDSGGEEPSPSDSATGGQDDGGLPEADLAQLTLAGGAALESSVAGSHSGSYVNVHNGSGATITWTFDVDQAGSYVFYTSYSVISDGQTMAFSVNGTARTDPIDTKDYVSGSDAWEDSWVETYNYVDLNEGTNTIQLSCGGSCDILIDRLYLTQQ